MQISENDKIMPIMQDNPSYFNDQITGMELTPVFYNNHRSLNRPSTSQRRREPLSSEDTDVFLSSCESNESGFGDNLIQRPLKETSFGPEKARNQNSSNSEQRKGFGQKLGQLFWKSKSKHSLGSESHVSVSTIESNPASPRFTPDSSLSIYTSSVEGDRESSNSSNSNQISPKDRLSMKRDKSNGNKSAFSEEQSTTLYRFDDCPRYAANMYYNMGEEDYTCRVQQHSRPRNNSVPVAESAGIGDGINEAHDYYMNPTFSTFPNPRRHSIAYSSTSSNGTSNGKKGKKHQQIIKQDPDGYLRPNEPLNSRNVKNSYYINEPQSPSAGSSKVKVHVDVHSPTPVSESSLNSTRFEAQNSSERNIRCNNNLRDFETSATTDDSQSTVLAGSICSGSYVPYQNGTSSEISLDMKPLPGSNEERKFIEKFRSGNKFSPVCLSRIRRVIGSDCERYCSLCGLTSTLQPTSTFKSRMDVAIVSCQECFFSKNAEKHIRGFFDKLLRLDNQKMDVNLRSYDLKDLEHTKVAADVHQCKVQIVIISHHFLQRLKLEASTRVRISPVNRVFRSKRVIAVMVGGVNQQEITEGYQAVLARFGEWFNVQLLSTSKLDSEFSTKFTEQVLKIYNLEQSNTSHFSVYPKKVTKDQSKIVVMLKKPLDAGDEVRVEFTCGKRKENATFTKIENTFTVSVRVPDTLCQEKVSYVEVTVYVNGHKLGATCIKSDLKSGQGDDDMLEKIAHMVPGFLKLFDEHIKQTLMRNYRECTDFVTDPSIELMNDVLICKGDEYPTVMHFAAFYGLEHTAFTVLDEGDGMEQCKIANDNDMRPTDIAEYRGHESIVQIINDYHLQQEINASISAFKKVINRGSVIELNKKGIVSKCKSTDNNNDSLPSYENLPETEITDVEVKTEKLQISNQNTTLLDDQKSTSSGGSYITWNFDKPINGLSEIVEPKVQKPKPVARSPRIRAKKDYVNVEGQNPSQDSVFTEEVVLRRDPRRNLSRDQARRQSISPIKDYDIPRLVNADYSIPPPDARPVTSKDLLLPVLTKKGAGSIQVGKDGYIFMHDEEENDPLILKEHIKYQEGTLIAVSQENEVERELHHIDSSSDGLPSPVTTTSPEFLMSPFNSKERKASLSSTNEQNVLLDPVDEELIQLMKDFSSSGYTIQHIELLFENWKSRPDVMRSIEEKKVYLKQVREEYKRMQSIQNTKGVSILDKFKSVLKGKKKSSVASPKFEHLGGNKFSIEDNSKFVQSRPSADRESIGSHESGSVPDSGVSEPESERERDNKEPIGYDSSSPKTYRSPLDRRFIPSYIGPDCPVTPKNVFEYEIPPPPRPLTSPQVPQKPSRNIPPTEGATDLSPPIIPQKPSHMRGTVQDDSENPPSPPPRTYIKPNPFNYIDYSQRTRGDTSKKVARSLSPYDNVKEEN